MIHIPGDERVSGAPGRISRALAPEVRHGIGDGAIGCLFVTDGAQEIGIKSGHIKVHHGFFGCDLSVAHPAHPLVTLAAIGGNAVEIGFLAPENEMLNVVEDLS